MASGRPVIMYKLEGMPDEYDDYFVAPNAPGLIGLVECLVNFSNMDLTFLSDFGDKAKTFVLPSKSSTNQAGKIFRADWYL